MGQVIAILGAPHSGVRPVSRMLAQCGLRLAVPSRSESARSTQRDNELVLINTTILSQSRGSWQKPPQGIRCDSPLELRIESFLQEVRVSSSTTGLNDPRLVLTWPAWESRLLAQPILSCVRHPMAVAELLQRRRGWSLDKSLQLWKSYNERLLALAQRRHDIHWFDSDQLVSLVPDWLARTCAENRLAYSDDAIIDFQQARERCPSFGAILDRHIQDLYEELLSLARIRSSPGLSVDTFGAPGQREPWGSEQEETMSVPDPRWIQNGHQFDPATEAPRQSAQSTDAGPIIALSRLSSDDRSETDPELPEADTTPSLGDVSTQLAHLSDGQRELQAMVARNLGRLEARLLHWSLKDDQQKAHIHNLEMENATLKHQIHLLTLHIHALHATSAALRYRVADRLNRVLRAVPLVHPLLRATLRGVKKLTRRGTRTQ